MKLSFNKTQLEYLDARMTDLSLASRGAGVDNATQRLIRKMKTKFTPAAASYVWLSQKERSLIYSMLEYRLRTLIEAKSASDELNTVSELMDVVVADAPNGSEASQ